MLVSRCKRFIVVHIYKTGGSSLTKLLAPYIEEEFRTPAPRFVRPGWQGTWHINGMQHGKLSNVKEIRQLLVADYRLIVFVRNPYTWVLSVWNNFYRSGESPAFKWFSTLFPERTFENYCRFVAACAEGLNGSILGASTQWSFVENPVKQPDFIGRFESFDTDTRRLVKLLDIQTEQVPHELRNSPEKREDWRAYYSPECFRIVNKLFDEDFARLGYEKTTA